MKLIHALTAVAVLSAPAPASDFSRLFKPELIRGVLLPFPRLREKQCAALVLARGEKEPYLPPALRTELLEAVSARLAIDTGNAQAARDALYDKAMGLTDDPFSIDPALRKAEVETLEASCAALFESIKEKGVAASLSPAPTGPIALPAATECYAAFDDAKRRHLDIAKSDIGETLEKLLFELPEPKEAQANRSAVATEAARLAAAPFDERLLEVKLEFACLPAIGELAKRFEPETRPVER